MPIALGELFAGEFGSSGEPVLGITLDSRLVEPGELYVALPGQHHHGAQFAAAAVAAGAVGVLTDAEGARIAGALDRPVVISDDPRRSMAEVAAQVYGHPARAMAMYAITGTNGKTTTSYLLAAALHGLGRRTGVIGTLGFSLDGEPVAMARTTVTTPESPELQDLLARMLGARADSVVMEVSSHALVLGRADAIIFDVAGFTNLGRDHLDFHRDEESYFEAKASLFTLERTRRAVIVIDGPRGTELVRRCRANAVPVSTVSLEDQTADYHATQRSPLDGGRVRVTAQRPAGVCEFDSALPGDYNVRNALTALGMLEAVAGPLDEDQLRRACAGLAAASVPGRMQLVSLGPNAPTVYVDFAHTPQAVAAVLAAIRPPQTAGGTRRCVVVLGCGGDRDPAKRRPMGAAAARGAAVVLVTDDNPRSEDPAAIRAEVVAGAREAQLAGSLAVEVIDAGERRSAIARALNLVGPGDVLAVLGKGHETGQEIAGQLHPFSDVDEIRLEWARRHAGVAS